MDCDGDGVGYRAVAWDRSGLPSAMSLSKEQVTVEKGMAVRGTSIRRLAGRAEAVRTTPAASTILENTTRLSG